MTDLATIRIPVDSSDMVKAVREAKNLEGGVNLLFNALKSGSISSTQFNKGLDNLTKQFKNLFRDSEQASGAIQAFANSVVALITGMTNNPRTTAQALARYGGYDFYEDDEDRMQIIQSAINEEEQSRSILGKKPLTESEKENLAKNVSDRMIKVSLDQNNRYQPQISPEQQKDAEDILRDLIVAQFPMSRIEDEPWAPRRGRGNSSDTVDKKALGLAKRVKTALSTEDKNKAVKSLNDIFGGKTTRVIWTGSSFAIQEYDPKGQKNRRNEVIGGAWVTKIPNVGWSTSDFGPALGYGSGSSLEKWNEAVESLK